MAQAIVDPEELRHFAMLLKRYNTTLADASAKMHQELERLAATWRDQQHQKFSAEFGQQISSLRKLLDSGENHVSYLMKKAELIEQYQDHG